ncbi:hypothetical protein E4T42_04662 [Aureobasidium subglaciale]|nr:hypothetical protein E4T42_04662 [Aureobasidium subglaciale]
MPYNTRRKSLSLSELGITVPKRSRASSQTRPSPPATVIDDEPVTKKPKRSHDSLSPPPALMSPPKTKTLSIRTEPPSRLAEHTPPPSPGTQTVHTIDTEGISDDVVVATIKQLEKTGNRPHLVKELAAVLCHCIGAVEKSANPANLISSRLTSYLNRAWPAVSPCPLAKYQSQVHPRPLYYFLTTQPHQPIPELSQSHDIPAVRRIITPALSSAADDEDEKYSRTRASLSPEVDLSSPELDEPPHGDIGSTFHPRHSLSRDHPPTTSNLAHNRRADSPPLELEERDFKQTANALQELRRASQEIMPKAIKVEDSETIAMSVESDETHVETTEDLFDGHDHLSSSVSTLYDLSSPMLRPQGFYDLKSQQAPEWNTEKRVSIDAMSLDEQDDDDMDMWNDFRSPENIDLDELECLLDAY